MQDPQYRKLEMIAYEAFLKRASIIKMPFMLKGSYVTRQYFPDGINRFPADMDWVYINHLDKQEEAEETFSQWVTLITEIGLNDGVVFRSFRLNKFWRLMDYAMADDFPTVNTDIVCTVHGYEIDLTVDISFNLPIEQPPVPLRYQPIEGEAFIVPFTVPLSLQVSWKIHQTLSRPRFKDLFDLTYLVTHPAFDTDVLSEAIQALVNECKADNIYHENLTFFFKYEFEKLFRAESININWEFWRNGVRIPDQFKFPPWAEMAQYITDIDNIQKQLDDFLQNLIKNLEAAGIVPALLTQPPVADYIENSISLEASDRRPVKNFATTAKEQTKPLNDTTVPNSTSNRSSVLKKFTKWLSGSK